MNNHNLSSRFHKTLSKLKQYRIAYTYIQTVWKKCLAEPCRARLHRSVQGRACLDIEASQEPRCRPTPLCRASGRTYSDSASRDSTTPADNAICLVILTTQSSHSELAGIGTVRMTFCKQLGCKTVGELLSYGLHFAKPAVRMPFVTC